MSDIEQKATVTVDVNGQLAEEKINKLQKRASDLRDALAEAYKVNDAKLVKKLESELKSTNVELRAIQKNATNIDQAMRNLSSAGPKELRKTLNDINRELNSGRIKRGTAEWKKYNEQAKLVTRELQKIKAEQHEGMSSMERFNSGLSKWGGTLTSVIAGLTGVTFALNKMRKDRDDKEESADNLKALTGLDDESIAWLTKQAEILSTTMDQSGLRIKQSSKDILEAYMLVGSAKPELLSDREALNTVTIEAMRLAAAAKIDLKESVDAVTLSMNQYSAGADQASKFTNILAAGSKYGSANVQSQAAAIVKSGVAASGAKVEIEQLVGSIEMLGEKGIKDEVAGTGLKKFFLMLQTGAKETNPAIVGFDKALENLEKKHMTPAQIKKMFGEEGYNVAKILIDNVSKVRDYTKAVTNTNIAVEQAAINSDNNAAKMAQMKNKLREIGIELMEKLNPSFNILGSYFTNLIKLLPSLIDFLQKHGATIVYLTTIIGTYITAKKLAVLWETKFKEASLLSIATTKLKIYWDRVVAASTWLYIAATSAVTGKTNQARLATEAFFKILKLNPFVAVVTGISAIIGALYLLTRRTNAQQKAMESLQKITLSSIANTSAEKVKVESLLKIARDETLSKENRLKALKKLNEISPQYLKNLNLEEINTDKATQAVDRYIASIQRKAKIQAAENRLVDVNNEILDLDKEDKNRNTVGGAIKGLFRNMGSMLTAGLIDTNGERIKKDVDALKTEAEELSKFIQELNTEDIKSDIKDSPRTLDTVITELEGAKKRLKELKNMVSFEKANLEYDYNQVVSDVETKIRQLQKEKKNMESSISPTGGELDDKEKKERIKKWEAESAAFKAHTISMYAIGKITKQESDDSILQSDKDLIEKKMTLYNKQSKEYNDFLLQLKQMDVKTQEECTKENIEEIDKQIAQRKAALFDQYASETLSKKAHEEGIIQLDREALVRKRNIYAKGSKEFSDYQRQIDDFDLKDKEKRQKTYEEKLKSFRNEYRTKSLKELKQKELDDLKTLLDQKLLKVEEYEKLKLAIEKKYAGLKAAQPGLLEKSSQRITNILNAAKSKSKSTYSSEDKEKADNGDFFFTLFGADSKERDNTLSVPQDQDENGIISHRDYLQAKGELDGEYYSGLAEKAQAAYAVVSSVLSAVSDYSQACQDLETAKINKKYDAEIKAAGKNSREVKQLEEKKEKELAKIKSKYANRAFGMNVAMGLAQTAIAAITAYSSALQIGPAGLVLAPIAATMAIATGMIQVATLKKQQEAAKQGYYSGGFTPSGRWDEEQGTVHSGEFIANRFAVQNKEILPVLRLIDNAQRNNTVGSLKAADVSRALNQTSMDISSPSTQSSPTEAYQVLQMEKVNYTIERTERTLDRLSEQLDEGIEAHSILDGEQGQIKAQKRYDKLIKNKSRA